MEASQLLEKLEMSEASREISSSQEPLSPKTEEIAKDTRSLFERNKKVMAIASLILVGCYCFAA
jgi:hypothetical protein